MRSSVTLLAPRWPKMRFVAHLGLHLDGYWGASWRQDGPRWRQVGQLGAKMCPRWPTWRPRWPTWRTFGSILATFFGSWARSWQKWRNPKKRRQFITLGGFLGSWGCSWRLCWLILALCLAMLGHRGAILEQQCGKCGWWRRDEPRYLEPDPRFGALGGRGEVVTKTDIHCLSFKINLLQHFRQIA